MAICGITVTDKGQPVETPCLEAMASALAMGTGEPRVQKAAAQAGFGAWSTLGTTPLFRSDLVMVACEADLCNRQELQSNISSLPPTATIAEMIGALYLEAGESFVKQLRGAFSLAIWDQRATTL